MCRLDMNGPKLPPLKAQIAEFWPEPDITQAELAAVVRGATTTVQNWEVDNGLSPIERWQPVVCFKCQLDDLVESVPTTAPAKAAKYPLPLAQWHESDRSFRGNSVGSAVDAVKAQEV